MRAALIVSFFLSWIASAAIAQTGPSPAQKVPDAAAQSQKGTTPSPDKTAKSRETPAGKSAVNDSLASCLAMWERGTHMSKQEWARACRRVDDRLRNTVAK